MYLRHKGTSALLYDVCSCWCPILPSPPITRCRKSTLRTISTLTMCVPDVLRTPWNGLCQNIGWCKEPLRRVRRRCCVLCRKPGIAEPLAGGARELGRLALRRVATSRALGASDVGRYIHGHSRRFSGTGNRKHIFMAGISRLFSLNLNPSENFRAFLSSPSCLTMKFEHQCRRGKKIECAGIGSIKIVAVYHVYCFVDVKSLDRRGRPWQEKREGGGGHGLLRQRE